MRRNFSFFHTSELEETHYDKTIQQIETVTTKPLDEIACVLDGDAAGRRFDEEKLVRWLKRCADEKQKESIAHFLKDKPSTSTWETFKKKNKNLFRGGKVKVFAPQLMSQYTRRKELRLLAYENNPNKTEKIFKLEWLHEDLDQIETSTPVTFAVPKWKRTKPALALKATNQTWREVMLRPRRRADAPLNSA